MRSSLITEGTVPRTFSATTLNNASIMVAESRKYEEKSIIATAVAL